MYSLLTGEGEGEGGRGAESYDRKKAWASINHSILSDFDTCCLFSLVNAIFCFTAVYFNIKNRPHHIISKDEAKVRITLDHALEKTSTNL